MKKTDIGREGLVKFAKTEVHFNFANFHQATKACFHPTRPPDREPDFVSQGLSVYWDMKDGVIRASDHWSEQGSCRDIASCYWTYAGICRPGEWEVGYAPYSDFVSRRRSVLELRFDPYDVTVARVLLAHGGGLSPQHWSDIGLGPIPSWCYRAPAGTLAADPARQYLADHPGASHVITSTQACRILAHACLGQESECQGSFAF